jgi:hypothetical protein
MKKPSVSELIDILNKPKLMHWANQLGLEGKSLRDVRINNTTSGTNKHSEIVNYIKKGIKMSNIESQNNLDIFLKDCNVIDLEKKFENDLFQGRVDIIFKKQNSIYIGDFKRTYKKPYLEHYIQLMCYKINFKCDKICIIKSDSFEINELSLFNNENLYIDLIHNLINIYNIKQQLS